MNKPFTTIVLVASLAAANGLLAAEPSELEPPPPPPPVKSGETLEPEVRIIDRDGKRVEEYSVNGRVYAAKITPTSGPSYYLLDTDGDGLLDTRHNALKGTPQVPQWVLFSW